MTTTHDLSALDDLVAYQDRGADCVIHHPVTGEPMPDVVFVVAGPDSDTQRRARLSTSDALLAYRDRPSAEDQERLAIEQLSRCVVGWRVKQDGQEVPFSFTAVVNLLRKFQFIREQVDVIALAPVIETGWEPVLMEAKLAGIPVIVTDRKADVEDESLYVTFIGSDFYDEGQKAAKYMLDKLSDRPGPVGIVELRGTEGSTPSIDRGRGFHDEMKQRGDLTVLSSEAADFTLEKGREVMRGFLEEHGSAIQVLFAHNDDMALGAIEAIEAYGLRPGKDIIIISVDGTRKAFEMMALGKINCVVECNPLLGPILMQAVKETMEGRSLPKHIVTPESVYTETTAAQEAPNRKY